LAITAACGLASCGKNKHNAADSGVSEGGTDAGICGDNKAEGSEMCDGTDLKKETCMSATMGVKTGGTLSCTATCTFNVSKCTGDVKKDAGKDNDAGGGGTGG
jgi:hypothetical protein